MQDFESIVLTHQRMVYSLAFHSLGEEGPAAEIAQDVFLALHRHLSSVQSTQHAEAWLRRVTAQRCIDQIRRRKLHRPAPLDDVAEPAVAAEVPDPWLRRSVRLALRSMPARARVLLILRYQEEMEPTEIAAMLQMPVNTVRSSLHRSILVLRRRLCREEVC
jgi:RNA polymerase sigma-70 factor, ECF subfamily